MGTVCLATQIALNRKVVIKQFSLNFLQDPKLVKSFETEVTSAAGLAHENIIKVFDFGEDENSFFIAMEYVDGLDLGRLMRLRPFPLEIGLMVLLQAIKGLNYAHKQGFVHCNIKPGNILISKTGKVKVVDFGLVFLSMRSAETNELPGKLMTWNYMPPEVAGGSLDRSISIDIWSTGVLAYQIICGTLPFIASDFQNLVNSIIHDAVKDVRSVVPTLQEELATEVNACLEKNPRTRPTSLDRLRGSLEKLFSDLGVLDIEKMIMNYIADKQSVDLELAGLIVKYNQKKNSDVIDAEDRFQPKALFPKRSLQSSAQKDGDLPMGKPSYWPGGFFDIFFPLRKTVLIIGSVVIVVLGILSVFIIVRNKREPGPPLAVYSQTSEPHGPPVRNPKQPVQSIFHADNELLPGSTAPKIESTSMDKGMKSPRPPGSPRLPASPAKKKLPVRVKNPSKSKPLPTPEKPLAGAVNPPPAPSPAPIPIEEKKKGIGLLHIHSYPWAEIYIDGSYQGTTPTPKPLSLPEGEHTVELKREGFKPYSGPVTIIRDEQTRIKVQLEK